MMLNTYLAGAKVHNWVSSIPKAREYAALIAEFDTATIVRDTRDRDGASFAVVCGWFNPGALPAVFEVVERIEPEVRT